MLTNHKPRKRKQLRSTGSSAPEKRQHAKGFFIILNDKGLHTRPSTELVKCTTLFKAEITLTFHDLVVNAKSLLGILTLAATRGSCITVEASGEDAEEAVEALVELARNKFHMSY